MISYTVNRQARVEVVVSAPTDDDLVVAVINQDGAKVEWVLNAKDARRLGQELLDATDHFLNEMVVTVTA